MIVLDLDDDRAEWNRPMRLRGAWIILALGLLIYAGACGWVLHAYVTGAK